MNYAIGYVFLAGIAAVFCTGLGVIPFLIFRNINQRLFGIANASAAGLMLGASAGLLVEGIAINIRGLLIGALVGIILIGTIEKRVSKYQDIQLGDIRGVDTSKMLIIIGIMTAHSFAEGAGVGVSFGNNMGFGFLIAAAIAVHKIPEGIAISLIMIPRGATIWQAAKWSMFTSLPLPLMTVLAYLAVSIFKPLLPVGLGIAAGGMLWIIFRELLPEAFAFIPHRLAYLAMIFAFVIMISFQFFLGA